MNKKSEKPTKILNTKAFCFALVLIGLVSNTSFGQSLTWQRTYNGPSQVSNDYGYATCRADGQNIYILGSISNWVIYLLKINQFGDTLWTRTIGSGFSRGRAIVESDSGSCVLTGDFENRQAFAIKVNKDGNIVWQNYYGSDYVQLNAITKVTGGSYLLCGRENFDNGIVLLIDSIGTLKWKKIYTAPVNLDFQSSCELNENNGFLLTGWKTDNPNSPAKGIIYKIDQEGKLIWDTTFTYMDYATAGRKIININNGYAVTGTIHNDKLLFLRIENSGKIANFNVFDSTYPKFDIGGFLELSNNRYMINYSQDSLGGIIDGKIIVFDTLCSIMKYKTYSTQRQITFSSITQLSDTGFIFCGTINNNTTSIRDIYVIKADTTFSATPIGIVNNTITTNDNLAIFKNYPNPFNPETRIHFYLKKRAKVKLIIYDINGRAIEELLNTEMQSGEHSVNWLPINLSNGIYFASLFLNENNTHSIKIILLK